MASERVVEDRGDETDFPPEVLLRIFSCLSGEDLLTRAGARQRLPKSPSSVLLAPTTTTTTTPALHASLLTS